MTVIKFNGDGRRFSELDTDDFNEETSWTHALTRTGTDHTLCGETMDGDPNTAGSFKKFSGKTVTCPVCANIIRSCRGYRIGQSNKKGE